VLELLRSTVDRGARVLSVCSAAFILGEAGLLDGRSCTTHWMYADRLARRFPAARVVPEVLFVDEDPVITSAGTGAGIDAALHLWRKEFGASIAATVADAWCCRPSGTVARRSSSVAPCRTTTPSRSARC
jgi:transcriptional regulator GlxA family with amidase domain